MLPAIFVSHYYSAFDLTKIYEGIYIYSYLNFFFISVNTNGAEDPYSDGDFDDDNTVFDNGVEGVAMLMEDLRNAVEATLDVEAIESDLDKTGFGDSLLKFISLDTLKFYRKLLRIQVRKKCEHFLAKIYYKL